MRISMTPLLLVSGLALASTALAAEPTPTETPVYFNGVKVAIDPVTGKLRQPTAAEMQQLRMVAPKAGRASIGKSMPKSQADAERTYRRNKDGSASMELPESSMSTIVATQNADGSITVQDSDATGAIPTSRQEAVNE